MNVQVFKESVINYFKESYAELKRVAWPSRNTLTQHTVVVIAFSLLIALFLGSLDILFIYGIERFVLNK